MCSQVTEPPSHSDHEPLPGQGDWGREAADPGAGAALGQPKAPQGGLATPGEVHLPNDKVQGGGRDVGLSSVVCGCGWDSISSTSV